MSTLSVGEIVRARGGKRADRLEGVVKFVTCSAATQSGGKTCDRNNCIHNPKDRVWVKWPDGGLCSYQMFELETDVEGEESTYKDMEELLTSENSEDAENATNVIKAILKARKNRATKPVEKVAQVMSKNTLMETLKADAGKAAYRVAARQINNGVRSAIIEMVKAKGASNANIEAMAMFLDTEWGSALLATIAGHGLAYIPGLKDDPRVQKLSEEFRVSGMTTVGNEIFSAALSQFLPVLTNALNSLPAETTQQTTEGHKSTEEVEAEDVDLSDLESHLEKEEGKKATLGR